MTNPFVNSVMTPSPTVSGFPAKDPLASVGESALLNAGLDPFADPTGRESSGEKIAEFVNRLLIVKPIEHVGTVPTDYGPSDNVMDVDLVVLDDPIQPGIIVPRVRLFQAALKREALEVFQNPSKKFLLARLVLSKSKMGNKLYLFQSGTDEDKALARTFLNSNTF